MTLDKVGSFCIGKINDVRNGDGIAFVITILESPDAMLCGPPTTTRGKLAVHQATDEISYDALHLELKVHGDELDAPFR